ncbi:HET-domain-containing protein [Cucurbitaria berberidis CBS 394.84]|uniref:HET-domain-containing protein n=1 Tax=Cucurbitaria berberidis CBS 394.84 TaxID=1168544 RepID=A0A9P4GT29_9PLEO|nr:HET-domain-containing protein [Cucurbitaria berberidis CBS 394.84]KAF1850840.1 HET-domain-containing protein [Cucurbitaria berberidis CBS 394.84]
MSALPKASRVVSSLLDANLKNCKLCSEIIRFTDLSLEDKIYEQKVGRLPDFVDAPCQAHASIVAKLQERTRHRTLSEWEDSVMLTKKPLQRNVEVLLHYDTIVNLAALPEGNLEDPAGLGRLTNPDWIDCQTLKDWYSRCKTIHGSACNGLASTLSLRPNLLIDTTRMCLTQAKTTDRYFALSYVWGQVPQLKTTRNNLYELSLEGSFGNSLWKSQIPRTIMDAIQLTSLMGEQFLWVDSLCIVQDDQSIKDSQLNGMSSIYANASLTIVAANGDDAAAGLHGIQSITKPRSRPQDVHKLEPMRTYVHCPPFSTFGLTWEKRGWTFQESLLSPRKLIFAHQTVQWQCQCAVWREDIFPDNSTIPVHSREDLRHTQQVSKLVLFDSSWPRLDSYNDLVSTFTTKVLTYPEDVLPAFTGFLAALSSSFPGGFLYGLPEMFFDQGLLWSGNELRPRGTSSPSVSLHLPSWSWMAWTGVIRNNLDSGFWKKTVLHTQAYTSRRTIPIVQWYYGSTESSERRPIRNDCSASTTEDADISMALQNGWTCHENTHERKGSMWGFWDFEDGKRTHYSGHYSFHEPDHYYTHISDDTSQFWYPVPLITNATERKANQLDTKRKSDKELAKTSDLIISCRTSKARLFSRDWIKRPIRRSTPGHLAIRDNLGKWVGCLDLQYQEQVKLRHDVRGGQPQTSDIVELVAISRGFAYNDWQEYTLAEWRCQERPRSGEKYEFYNVIWVEWHGKIAKRKALGRVHKEAWERLDLEMFDFLLQ